MMDPEILRQCLESEISTAAQMSVELAKLIEGVRGGDAWRFTELVTAAGAVDDPTADPRPPLVALILRVARQDEIRAGMLREFRAALLQAAAKAKAPPH